MHQYRLIISGHQYQLQLKMFRLKHSLALQTKRPFQYPSPHFLSSIHLTPVQLKPFSLLSQSPDSLPAHQHIPYSYKALKRNLPALTTEEKIEMYKNQIEEKTSFGKGLASHIASEVTPDTYLKMQRFEQFLIKMDSLYKSELRYLKKKSRKLNRMQLASVYSQTPLKDILREYNELSIRGFDGETMAQSLQMLAKGMVARGLKPRVMNDYTDSELDQSWRMQKVADDLKFAIKKDREDNYTGGNLLTPINFAKITNYLGEIGYKNSELIAEQFDKLQHSLNVYQFVKSNPARMSDHLVSEGQEYSLEQSIFGSRKNFQPRHYIFQGFQNSEEFKGYIDTLLEWKEEKNKSYIAKLDKAAKLSADKNVNELQQLIGQVVDTTVQVKEFQKQNLAAVESLREQYFKMQQATDKHAFLQENPYIKYEVLELQELLVNAGYLMPDEHLHLEKLMNEDSFTEKMERATQVFYDYALNYSPELISPNYEQLYEAAVKLEENQGINQKNDLPKEEVHNQITLGSLAQCLAGLAKQARSPRLDAVGKDYLNPFYENYLTPNEQIIIDKQLQNKIKATHIRMEREYLKSWAIFKERLYTLLPQFVLLTKETLSLKSSGQVDLLHALVGMNESKLDLPDLRAQIVKNCLQKFKQQIKAKVQHVITNEQAAIGLSGLARGTLHNDMTKELSKILLFNVRDVNQFTFSEQYELLWSLCALGLFEGKVVQNLVNNVNSLNFERVDHELKYEDYLKLVDIYHALEVEGSPNLKLTGKHLIGALRTEQMQKLRYPEGHLYDPFKDKVLEGLSRGLTAASISHSVNGANLMINTDQEVMNSLDEKYPVKPDIVMGYQGQKLCLFVNSEKDVMSDTNVADGTSLFKYRLLEKIHNKELKAISIPVTKLLNYDIASLSLSFNPTFSLISEIQSQLNKKTVLPLAALEENFKELGKLCGYLMKNIESFTATLESRRDIQQLGEFVQQIYNLFQLKQDALLKHDQVQQEAGLDEVRLALLKVSLTFENLSTKSKDFIGTILNKSGFKSLLTKMKDSIPPPVSSTVPTSTNKQFDLSWLGTRLEVEIPSTRSDNLRKSIVPEIINQRFMWVDDYFHYADWKQKQKETFDSFNLLVIPHNQTQHKFFYDREQFQRRIPRGIFPQPNFKRALIMPSANQLEYQASKGKGHDEFILFEKEPYKMMVLKEFKKQESLLPLTNEVSLITNLQNIKQSLKSDYNDSELLKIVLVNTTFTDQLIEEHLQKLSDTALTATHPEKYLPRDPSHFRSFIASTYFSKDREDPFTDFYIREAAKIERIQHLVKDYDEKEKMLFESKNEKEVNKFEQERPKVANLVERMLLENHMENEDLNSLSHALGSNVKVKYNVKSLMKSEFVYDVDPDVQNKEMTDAQFLYRQRLRAEQKLIKMKIIYKKYEDIELSPSEKKYLNAWTSDLEENSSRTLLSLRESMLPPTPTSLTFQSLDAKNLYSLNSIARVQIDRDLHGEFSLNELMLELSHFLDDEVVDKVELELFSKRVSQEWGLSEDFKLVETRNKEIGILLNELEEVFYRMAGMFTDEDYHNVKSMFSIKRNKDYFDKQFYDLDMESLRDFMNDVNCFDQRIPLLSLWLQRKEHEFKSRVIMPTQQFKKTDKQLHEQIEKDCRVARQQLVSQMLTQDEHGNEINKKYEELSSREIGLIAQNLAIRLYMFQYQYPAFVKEIVKGVIEHPNILNGDRVHLESFAKIFELDWRGDESYENKQEFLSYRPMYLKGDNIKGYSEMKQEDISKMIKSACSPYLEEVARKLSRRV